jgi:interferon-induced transmembrane protein
LTPGSQGVSAPDFDPEPNQGFQLLDHHNSNKEEIPMSQNWTPPPPPNAPPSDIPNYLVLSIIAAVVSFLMCCLPHGIVSVIFATQVNKKASLGDIEGAKSASKNAKLWATISIVVSVIWLIVSFIFGFFAAIMGALGNSGRTP